MTEAPTDAAPTRASWLVAVAVVAVGAGLCSLAGLPSPQLFGGMLAGIAVALWRGRSGRAELAMPRRVAEVGEVLVGATLGAYVQVSTVRELGHHVLPIAGVTLLTLALSVGAGLLLARVTELDDATASFGMIAGGASGIIPIATRLGADVRLVAVMQYVRVLVILVLTPLVATTVFGGGRGSGGSVAAGGALGTELLYTALAVGGGLVVARRTPLPAGELLGPMLVGGALALSGLGLDVPVPAGLQDLAFAIIGAGVGLRFTPASLRTAAHVLTPTLLMVLALLVATALLGLALAPLAHVSRLDAYLATTPGGLYAVLAAAVGGGANTTFVLAVQVLRLFVMLLAAPALAKRLAGRRRGPTAPADHDAPGG